MNHSIMRNGVHCNVEVLTLYLGKLSLHSILHKKNPNYWHHWSCN